MELDTTNQQVTPPAQNNTLEPVDNSPLSNQKGFVPPIIGVVILLIVVAGGAYYLGTRQQSNTSNTKQLLNTNNNQATISTPSPSPITTDSNENINSIKAWKHSTGYWLLYLPSSWSAASFDGGPYSMIKVYAKPVSKEELHSGKDLSQVEVMTINIGLTNNELTTDNKLTWKEENGEMQSNTLILESQKGSLSFSVKYPKNTNYQDQIMEVLNTINFKASPEELSKATTIP